jgi:hypothetical protein
VKEIKMKWKLLVLLGILLSVLGIAYAQQTVVCGEITEAEFTESNQDLDFRIELSPGMKVFIRATRFGDYLVFYESRSAGEDIAILAPSGAWVAQENFNVAIESPIVEMASNVLGEKGNYTIRLGNAQATGAFTLEVGCTLRDGTVINPGDTQPTPDPNNSTGGNPPIAPTACTDICFAGLPPKDLNNVARLPLVAGAPLSAALTPTGSEIYGFGLDATSEQTLTLNVTRAAGNLNVAIVLLTPDNRTAFAAVLTNNNTLSTDLVLPQDGQYTVAVFRADGFLPPATPEASVFTITGTLN